MLEVDKPADMANHVGKDLGASEWVLVDQDRINKFADATGDHQWIHVDLERARDEMPGGKTIAHGFLTLSLIPLLSASIYRIKRSSRGINYGLDRVRFTSPVSSGSRVRLAQTLKSVEPVSGGQRLTLESRIEIEGQERPALVAETIFLSYD